MQKVEQEARAILETYFKPATAHVGILLPLPDGYQKDWLTLHEKFPIKRMHEYLPVEREMLK